MSQVAHIWVEIQQHFKHSLGRRGINLPHKNI